MPATESAGVREGARERFERLAAVWHSEQAVYSNVVQKSMLQSYQNIIGMGQSAVPFMLEDLKGAPVRWFWALEAITLADPVAIEDRGDMTKMAAAWVRWGVENGYLPQ